MEWDARTARRLALACALCAPYAAVGCNGKKAAPIVDAGAKEEAGPADAGRDAAGPEAANELDVEHYEDEVAVDHVKQTVKTPFANAYRSYPKGEIITTLKTGAEVTQLAERNGFYRVTFDAPYGPPRRLMGWMARFVFEDATAAAMQPDAGTDGGRKVLYCKEAVRELPVTQDVAHHDSHCAYFCKDDLECARASATCEAAIILEPTGRIDPSSQYTTVCTDAGAPPTSRKVPSLYGMPHLANGKCPRLFAAAPKTGPLCYRSCKSDEDCPFGATCKMTATNEAKLCHAPN